MSQKNNQTIWLKGKNGILFEIKETDRRIYNINDYEEATKEEVEAYKKGTYWNQQKTAEAEKSNSELKSLQDQYKDKFGNPASPRFKNDKKWLQDKINE